jgi:hypothetical protein
MKFFLLGLCTLFWNAGTDTRAQTQLLADPGFEREGWTLEGLQGKFTPEAAKNGSRGLHLADDSVEAGAFAKSEFLPILAGKSYLLEGFARVTKMVFVSMRYFDQDKKPLVGSAQDGMKYDGELFITRVPDTAGEWKSFSLKTEAPKEAFFLQVWLHTYSKEAGWIADFDDLSLVEQ